jgi:hypothetical protein
MIKRLELTKSIVKAVSSKNDKNFLKKYFKN